MDYLVTDLLARPTTYVCAESCTAEDILKALKNGNAFVTESVNGPKLFLTCGHILPGFAFCPLLFSQKGIVLS